MLLQRIELICHQVENVIAEQNCGARRPWSVLNLHVGEPALAVKLDLVLLGCSALVSAWPTIGTFTKGITRESSERIGDARNHHSLSHRSICAMYRVQTGRIGMVTQFEPVLLRNLSCKYVLTSKSSSLPRWANWGRDLKTQTCNQYSVKNNGYICIFCKGN